VVKIVRPVLDLRLSEQ